MPATVHAMTTAAPRDKRGIKHAWDTDPARMGQTFVNRQQEVVLTIGQQSWTRRDLIVHLQIGSFKAASNLSKLANAFKATSVRDLASRVDPGSFLGEKGVGIMTAYVWLVVLEQAEGAQAPDRWLDNGHVTLPTLKQRATAVRADTPKKRRGR